jgi:hypothetical protein
MLFVAYRKSFELKLNSNVTLLINPTIYLYTLLNFFADVSNCKHLTWQNVQDSINFLPQHSRMIWWDSDKSHDFRIIFEFFIILKSSRHTFMVVFSGQNVENSFEKCWKFLFISLVIPQIRLNNMNTIFSLLLFYYFNHLQFKDNYNFAWNTISWLNIQKKYKKQKI